ncbi:hypothetical protein BGZ73_000992, partial [Actinomortierella ambigua]
HKPDPTMKLQAFIIASSIIAYAHAITCGGGSLTSGEASDLLDVLDSFVYAPVNGHQMSSCSGPMCVSCWDAGLTPDQLRQQCSTAAKDVIKMGYAKKGKPIWCDFPGQAGVNMLNYFRKY